MMDQDTMLEAGASRLPVAVVVYHGGCVDGLFAAAVAQRALSARGFEVELYAAEHKRPLPAFPKAQHIVCVDFCPPADELQDLRYFCPNVTVIDHHDSARELLMGVRSMLEVVFDLDESGATLAWRHYFPGEPMPTLLAYVRDRDLWRWGLPDSQAINASLQRLKREVGGLPAFELWDDPDYIEQLRAEGEVEIRVRDEAVASAVSRCHWRWVAGHRVPCTAMMLWESELGHALLKAHPEAPFAVNFSVLDDGRVRFSVRGAGKLHLGELMRDTFGGGGHPNAAGAMFPGLYALDAACPVVKEDV
jgi:oligoribonuclease NrnB/cAMP/cGMP phosphodiesterase (DHH superfamily)